MSNTNKKSKIWNYFVLHQNFINKQAKAKCNKCGTSISNIDGSTSAMAKHLNVMHAINYKQDENEKFQEEPTPKKSKTIFDFIIPKKGLQDIVAQLAAVDGISIRAITRSQFIRESILKAFGKHLPKNETDVMTLIHENFEIKKQEMIMLLQNKLNQNNRYSITLDEWASISMRRFVNINLYANGKKFNLGLVRIFGTCSASDLILLVTNHLKSFCINFETDVVSSTGDGCQMMVKFGRECPVIYQLCLNHGLHLGVCDALYKKPMLHHAAEKYVENIPDEEDAVEDDIDIVNLIDIHEIELNESLNIRQNIEKVREIMKYFKYSTVKNSILQGKIKAALGHELQPILDVRSRWNSMADMMENFFKIHMYVEDALKELNSSELLKNVNIKLISHLSAALQPIKLTVKALSREDATLVSSELAINFMKKKLMEANTEISSELLKKLSKRIEDRLNPNLMILLQCLRDTNIVPPRDVLNIAGDIMKRIFGADVDEYETANDVIAQSDQEVAVQTMSIERELDEILKAALVEPKPKGNFNKLKQEFLLFQNTGKRTTNLQKLYDALLTIKPTSIDAERTFSLSSSFCTKIRSRLSDKSLNSLVFLKDYYLNHNK